MAISANSCVGILGGTFNPIHNAHLRLAIEARERLGLDHVRLIPAARPPHRAAPEVPAQLRLAMVQAAVADIPGLVADGREICRTGPSYMVDTLVDLRREYSGPLALILGMDAFITLPAWYQWQQLIELAHLVVAQRPPVTPRTTSAWRDEEPFPAPLSPVLKRPAREVAQLHEQPAGLLYFAEIPLLAISSSYVRAQRSAGRSIQFLVPSQIDALICEHNLYR